MCVYIYETCMCLVFSNICIHKPDKEPPPALITPCMTPRRFFVTDKKNIFWSGGTHARVINSVNTPTASAPGVAIALMCPIRIRAKRGPSSVRCSN